jgi:hypothetical protein
MPAYGTNAFKELRLDLYLRRSFLLQSSYDEIAIAIAHELSHVALDSIHHPLRGCEKAVDLTAMLLGFRRLYLTGSEKQENNIIHRLGYLSAREVLQAHHALSILQENLWSRISAHLGREDIQKALFTLAALGALLGVFALRSLTSR